MSAWTRSPSCGRLIRVERPPHTWAIVSIALNPEEMVEEQPQGPPHPPSLTPKSLNQIFHLLRSISPSCLQIPHLGGDVQFSFSPQYTTMLPKFSEDGDAYLF